MRMLPTWDRSTLGNEMRKGVTCLGRSVCEIMSKLPSFAMVEPFLRKQRGPHRHKRGHDIFVQKFAQHDDAVSAVHRVHVDDAHVRRFHVLRPPFVSRTAIDDIPAQIVHGNHLRRHVLLLHQRPIHRPAVPVPDDVQVARIFEGPDARSTSAASSPSPHRWRTREAAALRNYPGSRRCAG